MADKDEELNEEELDEEIDEEEDDDDVPFEWPKSPKSDPESRSSKSKKTSDDEDEYDDDDEEAAIQRRIDVAIDKKVAEKLGAITSKDRERDLKDFYAEYPEVKKHDKQIQEAMKESPTVPVAVIATYIGHKTMVKAAREAKGKEDSKVQDSYLGPTSKSVKKEQSGKSKDPFEGVDFENMTDKQLAEWKQKNGL